MTIRQAIVTFEPNFIVEKDLESIRDDVRLCDETDVRLIHSAIIRLIQHTDTIRMSKTAREHARKLCVLAEELGNLLLALYCDESNDMVT